MTEKEIAHAIAAVAKSISDLTPSELAAMVPDRELREAILDVYGAGWDAGVAYGIRQKKAQASGQKSIIPEAPVVES